MAFKLACDDTGKLLSGQMGFETDREEIF